MNKFSKSLVCLLFIICCALSAATARAEQAKLYFVSSTYNSVFKANLDGTGLTNLGNLNGLVQEGGRLALDEVNRKMYVLTADNLLVQADLDGTNAVNFGHINGSYGDPYDRPANGIAVDPAGGKLYVLNEFVYWWDHYFGGFVTQANLDGTGAVSFGPIGSWTCGITLDAAHGKLNISSYGVLNSYNYKVDQMNTDGTGSVRLTGLDGLLSNPMGMALDAVNGKMYVVNNAYYSPGLASVVRSNLDGTGAENLGNLNGLVSYPVAVAVDSQSDRMYVLCLDAQWGNARIVQANLDGTGAVSLDVLNDLDIGNLAVLPSTDVAFASFASKLMIELGVQGFDSTNAFTLGAASNGIDPLTEDVEFTMGGLSLLIPAGSFSETNENYVFSGTVNGIALEAKITALTTGGYSFKIEGVGAENLPDAGPVTVSIRIGEDIGSADATVEFR